MSTDAKSKDNCKSKLKNIQMIQYMMRSFVHKEQVLRRRILHRPKEKNCAVILIGPETSWQNSPAVHGKSPSKLGVMRIFHDLIKGFQKEESLQVVNATV